MASRTTSTSHPQRPPSSSSSQQPQTQPPSQHPLTTHRRNLLSSSHSRRPQATHITHPRTRPTRAPDPTPTRPGTSAGLSGGGMSASLAPSMEDGTDEQQDNYQEEQDDIIIARPAGLLAGQDPTAQSFSFTNFDSGDLNAQAMAEVMASMQGESDLDLATASGIDPLTAAGASGVEDMQTEVENHSEKLIEMYRRRERDREKVDQEELKRALWESLREKVKSLEEDRWMFEVEGEGTVEA